MSKYWVETTEKLQSRTPITVKLSKQIIVKKRRKIWKIIR